MKIHQIFISLCLLFCTTVEAEVSKSNYVIVSVAPYSYFVKQIAGDKVNVGLFVPLGASFHDYEPSPKQVLTAGKADIWFRIGESFEERAIQALKGHDMSVKIVDLRTGVDLIYADSSGGCRCCHSNGADLHIWLSPKEAKTQAQTIAATLIEVYPEHRDVFQERLVILLSQLDELNGEIVEILAPLKSRIFLVGHPAYAYFARDYHLQQVSIETEGKDPTPSQLTSLLQLVRTEHLKTIFTQKQYGTKPVRLVADEIGAKIVMLDPYSDDYFVMMRDIATKISQK